MLYGVGDQYFDVRGLKLASGRLFDEDDIKQDAQVAVIDDNVKTKLFGDGVDPLGKTILFKKTPAHRDRRAAKRRKQLRQLRLADGVVALHHRDAPDYRRNLRQLDYRENSKTT